MRVLMKNSFTIGEYVFDQKSFSASHVDRLLRCLCSNVEKPIQIPNVGKLKLALEWMLQIKNIQVDVEWKANIDLNDRIEVEPWIIKVIMKGTIVFYDNMNDSTQAQDFETEMPGYTLDYAFYNDPVGMIKVVPFDLDMDISNEVITINL